MTDFEYDAPRHQWIAFAATVAGRDGRTLYESTIYPSRAEAAHDAFSTKPRANHCSTSRAHRQSDGSWHVTGNDMQWHSRHGN